MSLRALLPARADLEPLPRSWRGDIVAGLTVGIVALPLALAFGMSSGVGAAAGLVTAIVAGIVAAVFGGSHVQVSGPTGAMTVVLAPIVVVHGAASVALICLLAGLFLVVAGVFKLGRFVNVIPWPVVEGFTTGIAIIIFLQQIPAALNVVAPTGRNPLAAAANAFVHVDWHTAAWPLGAVALVTVLMVGGRLLHRGIPGSLIAIVVATLAAEALGAPLARIGALPDSLPTPAIPHADLHLITALAPAAVAVAALAAIESLLAAKVAAGMSDTGDPQPDRELFGQGLASIATGLFGGMPATGAIARTAVSVTAGARSRLASIVHALLLLAVVYLLSVPVTAIPLAALSGVLMVVSAGMIDVQAAKAIAMSTKSGSVVYLVTAAVTVMFDLVTAVGIGIVVAAFFALRTIALTSGVRRDSLPGPACLGDDRIALFRINGSMFFAATDRILDQVRAVNGVDVAIISLAHVTLLDSTGAHKLSELIDSLEQRGIVVLLKGMTAEQLRLVERVAIGSPPHPGSQLFADLAGAISQARAQLVNTGR